MTDSNCNIPHFRIYRDGEPIPAVDPEDVKRVWKLIPPWRPGNDQQSACSPGADVSAVTLRTNMIDTLNTHELLTPWKHGEELDDAVFRVAATFPVHGITYKSYKIAGDELYPFDPNAFVRQLIDETGIQYVWKPVPTRLEEGGLCFTLDGGVEGQDPDTLARRGARELAWEIWKRFAPSLDEVVAHSDKEHASLIVATLFADFMMDNMDLINRVQDWLKRHEGDGVHALKELERKAQSWP